MKQATAPADRNLVSGVVVRTEGQFHWVRVDGEDICCVLRGRLKKEHQRRTRLAVAGDRVELARHSDGSGTIEKVCRRASELVRPGFHGEEHVMAANLDQVVVVQSARTPPFELHLVERFVAMANRGRMSAVVVINKTDLGHPSEVADWVAQLRPFAVPVVCTSTVTGEGLEELRRMLTGRLSALAGRSGVGKSSLINALYPGFDIRTNVTGDRTEKGQHTTTTSTLYALSDGGYLADTPGIRELSLFADEDAVVKAYPDLAALACGCRYSNCTHTHEPGCAVKAALERGEIDEEYYRGYAKLMRGQRR